MSLPSTRAGPNQVREYLAHILHSKHDVPLSTAHKIANKWQLGRPNDLRQEGVDYFKQVFGTDAGRFLFRTVQEDIEAEWRESTIGVITYWTNIFSIVLSVFFVVRAFCRSEEKGIMASIRHATLAFGPPMLFCGLQDNYSAFQPIRIVAGVIVSFFAVLSFLFYVTGLVNRMEKRQDRKIQGNKVD